MPQPDLLETVPFAPGPQGPSVLLTTISEDRTVIVRIPVATALKIRELLVRSGSYEAERDNYPEAINKLLEEGEEIQTIGTVRTDSQWGWYEDGDDENPVIQ